jgi:TonB family protein
MTGIFHSLVQVTQLPFAISGWRFALLSEVLIKGSILLLLAGAVALALRRASAASRHLVWTLALSSLLALPLFALMLPAWEVALLPPSSSIKESEQVIPSGTFAASPMNPQIVAAAEGWQSALPAWILLLWVVGPLLFVARMAVGEVRVRRLASCSHHFQASHASSILESARQRLRVFRTVELRTSTEIAIPFTRGVFRPVIILPEEARQWPQEQLEFVLAHELAHVYRHDCLTQLPAQIACALLWFHPLVWFAAIQMRKERERACDDVVLSVGHPAADYAEFLLALGRCLQKLNPISSTTVAMAQPSQLEVRMKALLDSKLNHRPLPASRVLFAAVIAIVLLVPGAAIRATAREATANNDAANISGRVLESGKSGASGAKVTLVDSRTLKKLSTSTNQDGRFEFANIAAGGYKLEITKPGFAPIIIPGLVVAPSRNVVVYGNIGPLPEAKAFTPSQVVVEHRPHRIRVGRQVQAKKRIHGSAPQYPPLAKTAGIQGTVKLDAVIDAEGAVKDLKVLSGHPLLVKASLDAVKDWRYKPTLLNGVPIEVETTITVDFTLKKDSR